MVLIAVALHWAFGCWGNMILAGRAEPFLLQATGWNETPFLSREIRYAKTSSVVIRYGKTRSGNCGPGWLPTPPPPGAAGFLGRWQLLWVSERWDWVRKQALINTAAAAAWIIEPWAPFLVSGIRFTHQVWLCYCHESWLLSRLRNLLVEPQPSSRDKGLLCPTRSAL